MSITVEPLRLCGNGSINQVISFHVAEKSDVFYQEIKVPFLLMLMSVKAGDPESSTLSVYTADAQYCLPSAIAIKGRPENSQHQHNCFEFTYVLEGSMYQLVEGKRFLYPSGSCCLMNRNTLHTEEVNSDFTCVFLTLSSSLVNKLLNDELSRLFPQEQTLTDNRIVEFLKNNTKKSDADTKDFFDFIPRINETEQQTLVHGIFERLLHLLIEPTGGATFQLYSLLLQLISVLGNEEYYNAEHVTIKSNLDSLLFSRIDRIMFERHGRISNGELAKILNYNGSYLGRIVKRNTGKSIFDYGMTFAMAYAAKELRDTKRSVADIAAELRFTNRSHFYRLFRESYGMTPKEYQSMVCRSNLTI